MEGFQKIFDNSFNPLPLPKQGETGNDWWHNEPGRVSIRSPYRSKGRPFL